MLRASEQGLRSAQKCLQWARIWVSREGHAAPLHRPIFCLAGRKGPGCGNNPIGSRWSWQEMVVPAQQFGPFSFQQSRGAKVNGSEVRAGQVIERNGRLCQVLRTQHTQQGRGGAVIQAEVRDVQSGLKSTERFRTSEAIERVFVEEKSFTFLYEEGGLIVLMDPTTFEQVELSKELFGGQAAYLTDGLAVSVQEYDGKPLSATVPSKVTCTVAEAEPYFKGQTATPTYKKAVLTNGATVMVPSFIVQGDEIVVDTASNSYVTRSKE